MDLPKIRTDEAVRAVSGNFNTKTGERHYVNEVHFSFYNHREITDAMREGRAIDLARVPKQPKKSVLITGSGPTLDEALPLLKDWEGDIICSTSQAVTLMAWGRIPEHICALDPDSHPSELEPMEKWRGTGTILHMHPGVTPDLVKAWEGPIALFRKLQPQTSFYAGEQAAGYSELGPFRDGRYWGSESKIGISAQIPMLACVLPAQMSIAKHIGYRQQVLVGADFSFPHDKQRLTSRSWKDGKWIDHEPIKLDDYYSQIDSTDDPLVETEFDGLKTTPMQIFYAHQTVIAWRVIEVDIVNASHLGLLRMFPHVPIQEVIRRGNKGVKGFNLKQIIEASEAHLARQNIYFIYVANGVMPHEFKDPLHELPRVIPQIKQQLVAQGRGDDLDIEANMKRIKRLFAKVADAS